jgi:hypothetical protein
MNRFATDLFQVLCPGFDNQIGGGDCRKTIRGAGTAQQTVKKRLFDFRVPFQAPLDNGPQKGQATPGDTGLVPGGSEYRTSHLTEPAAVAMGYFIVMFGNFHNLFFYRRHTQTLRRQYFPRSGMPFLVEQVCPPCEQGEAGGVARPNSLRRSAAN